MWKIRNNISLKIRLGYDDKVRDGREISRISNIKITGERREVCDGT